MTILPTLIQSVAHPPRRDVTQTGSKRTLLSEPVQAAPFHKSQAKTSEDNGRITGGAGPVTGEASRPDAGRSASATSERMDATAGETAPFPIPQASSSQATAGNSAMSAHDLGAPPLSINPAFLAAWRETQAQPTDAEPRRS